MTERGDWNKRLAETPQEPGESKNKWFQRLADKYNHPVGYVKKHYYTHHYNTDHPALAKETEKVGIPLDSVGHYWHKGKHFSIFSKTNQKSYFQARDEIVESMASHSPVY